MVPSHGSGVPGTEPRVHPVPEFGQPHGREPRPTTAGATVRRTYSDHMPQGSELIFEIGIVVALCVLLVFLIKQFRERD